MHYEYSYAIEEGLGALAGLISGFPVTVLNLASYVLMALALYTVAQRRGIMNPWLAWIPVVNCWIVGSLSDQYRYLVKGEIKAKRKVLLALNIAMSALVVAVTAVTVVLGVGMAMGGEEMIGLVIALVCIVFVIMGVSIARFVVHCMALNDIYRSMDPDNSALFLVLSIVFSVTEPFFLFFNRNKDLGMPPRREAVQPPVEETVWHREEQEPWETSEPQE